jgi:osmoprotectant transport system substrate-binding protein
MQKKFGKTNKIKSSILTAIAAIFLFSVFVNGAIAADKSAKKIIIGSKPFAENQIIAKLYQYALEENGFTVEFVAGLDNNIIWTALENGDIDFYPEYTNTGIVNVLKLPPILDPDEAYRTVKAQYKEKLGIFWLEPSTINNTYALVVPKKIADKLNIADIADVQTHAKELTAIQQGVDWEVRPDHLKAMEAGYGKFEFKERKTFEAGLRYSILLNGQGDVTMGYTTDPQLEDPNLVTLTDSKHIWPPYHLAPIIRQDKLTQYPEIENIINNVTKKLDAKAIIKLSADVVLRHEEYDEVAKTFYEKTLANK